MTKSNLHSGYQLQGFTATWLVSVEGQADTRPEALRADTLTT